MTHEVNDAVREAYLRLNMLPEFDAVDVRAGRWDNVTGMQQLAAQRDEGRIAQRAADLTADIRFYESLIGGCRDQLAALRETCPHTWRENWENNVLTGPQQYGRTCVTCGLTED